MPDLQIKIFFLCIYILLFRSYMDNELFLPFRCYSFKNFIDTVTFFSYSIGLTLTQSTKDCGVVGNFYFYFFKFYII